MKANIYLSGFMGSGKSTVGKLLAKRMGARFVDADAVIEKKSGSKIADIFTARGEKTFRRMERKLLASVTRKRGQVVALGGGALLDFVTRRRVVATGVLVRLSCSETELWRRLKPQIAKRPLLNNYSPRANLRRLIKRRRWICPVDFSVSTTTMTPAQVAREIAKKVLL